jgi:hypothetical protein
LASANTILRREQGAHYARALIDVDGFIVESDPRLIALGAMQNTSILRPPVVLGSYGLPIPAAEA